MTIKWSKKKREAGEKLLRFYFDNFTEIKKAENEILKLMTQKMIKEVSRRNK